MSYASDQKARDRRRAFTAAINHYVGQFFLLVVGLPVSAVAIRSFWWPMTSVGASLVLLAIGFIMLAMFIALFFGLIEID